MDTYSSDDIKSMTDSQYGKGASDYIVKSVPLLLGEQRFRKQLELTAPSLPLALPSAPLAKSVPPALLVVCYNPSGVFCVSA